jgi:RNA polymerase sigma-70 factor, ECF subfamily
MELTDKTLMLAVKSGDLEQFGMLFERHHHAIFAFFYRMTAEASASEDLTQEVFIRMLKYRNTFGEDSEFRGWMYQIARNLRADHFRNRRPEAALLEELQMARDASPSQRFEHEQRVAILHRALLALREDKRELLILARYEEMKYEEIASLLSIEVGAVKVRVHRALRELRELFFKMSGEESECDVKKPTTI